MATTTSQIEIRINKDIENIIRAKQMDSNSRFLQITLLQDDGTAYDLTGHTARFNARKQDLTHVFNDCEMTDPTNGIITVELTDQTLAIGGGKVIADIGVYNSDGAEILTTRTFEIEVQTTIRDDSAIESSDEYGAVVTLFQDVWDIRDRIVRIDELLGDLDDDIPEGGDQASKVSFMGAVNRSYNMMLSQGIIGLDVVIYAQTVLQNVNSASAAWAFEIANRQGKLGMLIDTILNLGDTDLQEMTSWAEILANDTAFDYIVNSEAAMAAAAESDTAMAIIIANDTLMASVVASSAAMAAVAASETGMSAITASDTAMAAVASSETAMTAIAASEIAMTAIATSGNALNTVCKSTYSYLFTGSSYNAGVFETALNTCISNADYFTLAPVAAWTTYGNVYYHNISTNAWGAGTVTQQAIYFVRSATLPATNTGTIREVSYNGNIATIASGAGAGAMTVGKMAMGTIGMYYTTTGAYATTLDTATTNTYGAAFIPV